MATMDWSPLVQSIQSLQQQRGQQLQFNQLLDNLPIGPQTDLFRKLPPNVGMPLLLQTIQSSLAPKNPIVAHEGDVGFDATGKQIFSVPKAQKFGEKGQGINPASGKPDTYVLDDQGNVKWTGVEPTATPIAPNSPERQQQLLDLAKARGTQPGNVQSVQQAADGSLIVVHRDGTVEHMNLDGSPVKGTQAPQAVFNRGAAQAGGRAAGTQAESFPVVDANYNIIKNTLASFEDPNVKAQSGRALGLAGILPTIPGINSDFMARYAQLQGQTFLQAYNTLKGAGQITEVEGAKGTAAIARLSRAQTPTEFYKALEDAKTTFADLYASAKQRAARGAVVPELQNQSSPNGQTQPRLKYNPATGRVE